MDHTRVNDRRLHASVTRLGEIGATSAGGVTRLALTDDDKAGRDQIRAWMEEAGLTVRVDDFGNMIGRRSGTDPGARPVIVGSHCDSVQRGGKYDGALGVLSALEAVRTLNELGVRTRHPIEVINWTNEEGARFEPAMMCSGAVTGRFTREYVYARTDRDGLRFGDELARIGYMGDQANRPGPGHAYIELHIEQGPVLEAAGVPVGVVEGIVGITWSEVTVIGRQDHAGPSPMHLRRDALAASARIITGVESLTRAVDSMAVGTVGRLDMEPNIINVIPGKVGFSVDFRHPDSAALEQMVEGLQSLCEEVAAATGTQVSVNRFWTSEPTPFDRHVVMVLEEAARGLGLSCQHLWSGAGHDAKYMAGICPAGMIFIRSRGGLSHCEDEYSAPEDIDAGVRVLLRTIAELAEVD